MPNLLLSLLAILLCSSAFGAKVTISTAAGDAASQLEVRNLTLPDGAEVQYYVVKGSPVTVTIDDQQLIADEVEIDFTNKLVRVVGFGTFKSADETIAGNDLVIELEDQTFSGQDVLIVTEAIDVLGVEASRVPGQIDVLSGRFSPCSRCNQTVQDYGFRAKRLELYPGDRLVAFEVTVVVRELPVLLLPLLVIPLAPPDRQPRLSITQGSATARAEVAVDLPYVAGPNALGTFSVRYYADIVPGAGNLFTNGLLGGRTTTSYLGGGVNHRFYTETGQGSADFFYVPSFITYDANRVPTGKTRDEVTFRVRYATAEELADEPGVSVAAFAERDDERRQRLVEYGASARFLTDGFAGTFSTVGFFDLDRNDGVTEPSYDTSTEPLRTLARIELAPAATEFSVGPFRLSTPRLDLGVFEDQSNPTNRSAAASPRIVGGRLLESHSLRLEPQTPWSGFTVSARTDFTGQYYTTQNPGGGLERQIDWYTQLDLDQNLGFGNFGVTFVRDINEGETPFLFDSLYNLGNVVRLDANLRLDPAPWLSFSTRGGYVFVFENRPDATGLEPLTTDLTLFGNTSWFSVTFQNTYDFREKDPGTLLTQINIRSPEPSLAASLTVTYVADFNPLNVRGERDNEGELTFAVEYGFPPYLSVDFSGGYTFEPPVPEAGEAFAYYQPFEFGLTLGTLDLGDAVPGLRLSYARDLNDHETQTVGVEFTATVQPFEVAFRQRFDFQRARDGLDSASPSSPWQDSSLSVRWRGVAMLELTGYPLIPPELIGLDYNPDTCETYGVIFTDDLTQQDIDWRLSYTTTRNPTLNEGRGGFENSGLEARASVQNVATPALQFGVELLANLALADDAQPETYLRNLNLSLATSLFGVVGVQGALRYDGAYDVANEKLSTSRLTIGDVAFSVKFFDQLYVGAIFNDVWDFTNTDPAQSPYTFQPELRVVWDRCCWALYASLDTKTGAVSITLTTPGANRGFSQGFDSGFTFPRALLDTPPGGTP